MTSSSEQFQLPLGVDGEKEGVRDKMAAAAPEVVRDFLAAGNWERAEAVAEAHLSPEDLAAFREQKDAYQAQRAGILQNDLNTLDDQITEVEKSLAARAKEGESTVSPTQTGEYLRKYIAKSRELLHLFNERLTYLEHICREAADDEDRAEQIKLQIDQLADRAAALAETMVEKLEDYCDYRVAMLKARYPQISSEHDILAARQKKSVDEFIQTRDRQIAEAEKLREHFIGVLEKYNRVERKGTSAL